VENTEKVMEILVEPRLKDYYKYKVNKNKEWHIKKDEEMIDYLVSFMGIKFRKEIYDLIFTFQKFLCIIPSKEIYVLEIDLEASREDYRKDIKENMDKNMLQEFHNQKKNKTSFWKRTPDQYYKG